MKCESEPGQMYFIDVDTVNSGIPYADSFYVELSYCLSKCTTDGNLVKINSRTAPHMQYSHFYVFAAIKYKKTVWGLVKSKYQVNIQIEMDRVITMLLKSKNAFDKNSLPCKLTLQLLSKRTHGQVLRNFFKIWLKRCRSNVRSLLSQKLVYRGT